MTQYNIKIIRVQVSVLRIPDDKLRKPHKACTNTQQKASHSGENKLKVDVSWAQALDNRVPAIPTIATR